MKTEVRFKSTAFNCTEPKPYFLNPDCFGDDLCRWLMNNLHNRGIQTADEPDEPAQEDFGWYFTFTIAKVNHCFLIGFQPNYPATGDQWIGWLERDAGFIRSLFGRRNKDIRPEAVTILNEILCAAPEIRDVSWHERER